MSINQQKTTKLARFTPGTVLKNKYIIVQTSYNIVNLELKKSIR